MDVGSNGLGWFDDPETLVTVIVVVVLGSVLLGIAAQVVRYQRMRSQARTEGWRWLGKNASFGRLVVAAFPDLAQAAKRSARRNVSRRNVSRGNGSRGRGGNGVQRAAGLALDISGAGTRTRARTRGRHVAVASGVMGDITVGEAVVSVRTHRRRVGNQQGRGSGTSSVRAAAAAARLGAKLPTVRLTPRTLLHRVTGGDDTGLPEELCKRFAIEELSGPARAALIDSGAWRELLTDDVKVQGLTVANGHIVVMTRRRITGKRARALVRVVERLVAALPETTWPEGARGRLTAAVSE